MREVNHRDKNVQRCELDRPPDSHPNPRRFQRALLRTHSGAFGQAKPVVRSDRGGVKTADLTRASSHIFADLIDSRIVGDGPRLCLKRSAQAIGQRSCASLTDDRR